MKSDFCGNQVILSRRLPNYPWRNYHQIVIYNNFDILHIILESLFKFAIGVRLNVRYNFCKEQYMTVISEKVIHDDKEYEGTIKIDGIWSHYEINYNKEGQYQIDIVLLVLLKMC